MAPRTHHAHRHRRWRGRHPPPGSAPGTLVAPFEAPPPTIRVIAFDDERLIDHTVAGPGDLAQVPSDLAVTWIDVQGLGDLDAIRAIGARFGLGDLTLADVVHANQRPKLEHHENHLFVVARMPRQNERLALEQLSLVVGPRFVLTFQEQPGDCFDPVRARLRRAGGRIRRAGADYLAYALIDALIDAFFPLLEHYGEGVDALEDAVVQAPDPGQVTTIHGLKRDLLELRRALWPLRDVIAGLVREDTPLIDPATRPFLRDCADHVAQLMDMIELAREVTSDLMDVHLSSISLRMNDVMKVLTVIATIFIPLGFIAGLYGMNFDRTTSPFNMPELGWYFGYPLALGLMAAVALGLLGYFRSKGWLGGSTAAEEEDPPPPTG